MAVEVLIPEATQTQVRETVPTHPPDVPLAIDDLSVAYNEKPVLWDVDLDILRSHRPAPAAPRDFVRDQQQQQPAGFSEDEIPF